MSIEVRHVTKSFGAFVALSNVSLTVPGGELVALLGPSGGGKTSLLRIIAGLEAPDAGTIHFHGENATHREARERGVGFVFQHYALFRRMSVFENVAFGLRVKPRASRPGEEEIRRRVMALLTLVGVDWLHDRPPGCLFAPRCTHATRRCEAERPGLAPWPGGEVRCHYPMGDGARGV
ncbi:MAG TPA: ATP-binding cassette domain-containing protein, partial [Thermoanaerobaculia bacterium]|nr:ATP-binding cassette domain-containing protein [Thermoanaerobaculia bacterium]